MTVSVASMLFCVALQLDTVLQNVSVVVDSAQPTPQIELEKGLTVSTRPDCVGNKLLLGPAKAEAKVPANELASGPLPLVMEARLLSVGAVTLAAWV